MWQRRGISSTKKLTSRLWFGVLLGFYRATAGTWGMLVSSSCLIVGKELLACIVLYKIGKHISKGINVKHWYLTSPQSRPAPRVPGCQATAWTLLVPSGSAWLWGEIWRKERRTYQWCLVPPSVISWHWLLAFSSVASLSNQPAPTACSVRVTRPPRPSLPPGICGKSTDARSS